MTQSLTAMEAAAVESYTPAPARAPEYRYIGCDLLTGRVIEELPLDCESYSVTINAAGALDARLHLGSGVAGKAWRDATEPRRTALYVLRDDVPVWGGIIWGRRPDNNGTHARIKALSLEDYYRHRFVKATPALSFTDTDQLDIVRALLDYAAGEPGGDIRVQAAGTVSGVNRTVTYNPWERKQILEAWLDWAELDDGFEFYIDVTRDPAGAFRHTLVLGSPTVGRDTGTVFELPGNVTSYSWDEDGTGVPNAVTVVGPGEGDTMPLYEAVDFGELAGGAPLIEAVVPHKDSSVTQTVVEARAREELAARLGSQAIPQITVRGDRDPVYGTYGRGDTCRVRITSQYHPADPTTGAPGIDATYRITGWTVRPAQAGRPETVTLALGRP